jgi:Zn-dependent protease
LNGLALVSLAGPASNVVMAVILAAVADATVSAAPAVSRFTRYGVQLSLYLGLFNLLPVPPLDGSKLLLAARIPVQVYTELARYGFVLLIVLISATSLGRWLAVWSYDGAQAIFRGLGAGY